MASVQKKRRRRSSGRRISAEERRRQLRRRIALTCGLLLGFLILLIAAVNIFRKGTTSKDQNLSSTGENTVLDDAEVSLLAEEESDGAGDDADSGITPTPEPDIPDYIKNKPDIDINSWEYILANSEHSIQDYTPNVEEFEGVYLDERIIDAMSRFVSDTRAQGLDVVMTSGYRSYETQTWLFENKVAEYGDEEIAATIVARPGTSEHQTGLAADICDDYYEYMNESLENTATYQWMSKHCHEYGFIVRFPKGREDVTGIIYEPWHYRYVGVEAATYIMENDLTLEEFVALYQTEPVETVPDDTSAVS